MFLFTGGANYAYQQIEAELKEFICKVYNVDEICLEVAVVGVKVQSEHEDDCCVIVQLNDGSEDSLQLRLEETFLSLARQKVSKGAKPDHLRFANIPKNFKGAILVPDMKAFWKTELKL